MSIALENGIAVLEYISSKRASSVTEIADAIGLHKSTVSRIIKTFMQLNMVDFNRISRMYSVGPAILQMSNRYYKSHNIVGRIKNAMISISKKMGESVHLCALSNDSAVVVDQAEGASSLAVNAKIGNREPLHASSVGKCLLAFVDESVRDEMLKDYNYRRFTDKTICDEKALVAELQKIKKLGYAIDNNELSADIKCVAVPIINNSGRCIYSLGVSGTNSNMTQDKMQNMINLMSKISKALKEEI